VWPCVSGCTVPTAKVGLPTVRYLRQCFGMALPENTVALSPDQIAELNKKLSAMRHNVNNHLALIIAATELLKRKPELAERMLGNIMQQPERIISEVRAFSDEFEAALGITRESFSVPLN
jgi:hypothetical protein